MQTIPAAILDDKNWYCTNDGQPRGYIQTSRLRELWFHTGTACNLACPFCLEGSKPGDDRLQLMALEDVQPFIEEALGLGVESFSFTGGEPFVARDMHRILGYAARRRPCLVLTNGTRPVIRRMGQIEELARGKLPIRFRVSVDFPDPERHEAGRGKGTFHEAMGTMRRLHDLGFEVSLARQWTPHEDSEAVEARFRTWFEEYGLPRDLVQIWFPDFHPPGRAVAVPEITEDCMTRYHTEETRARFMCAFSRMVVKTDGRLRVYACTLVDDDSNYDLGGTLRKSLDPVVMLGHHRCYSCFRYGASCSEG
ncbi:MAG: radical SAM protein [Halioglobus sp.]|nr:radical SAM protein [Halioglobus sp.]